VTDPHPHAQSGYQLRFDWGAAGAAAILPGADVLVWVDQLGEGPVPSAGVPVVGGRLQNAAAVAAWALARQEELGGRFRIAVAAAGALRPDGSLRFAVEDLLAAGAVIEELAALGIDHSSPEAAAAAASYTGLRRAARHLLSASASARESGEAIELTPSDEVPLL